VRLQMACSGGCHVIRRQIEDILPPDDVVAQREPTATSLEGTVKVPCLAAIRAMMTEWSTSSLMGLVT
jgi:hypothetical protein